MINSRHSIIKKRWRKNNPKKHKAQYKAIYHIIIHNGQLCEICKKNEAKERHHEDYNKPLDVKILCSECHKQIHKRRKK